MRSIELFNSKSKNFEESLNAKLSKFVKKLEDTQKDLDRIKESIVALMEDGCKSIDVKKFLQNTYLAIIGMLDKKRKDFLP